MNRNINEDMINHLYTNDNDESTYTDMASVNTSNEYDLVNTLCTAWNVVSMDVSNTTCDFRHLKNRINTFIEDHPRIVNEIKDYFYDELIEHILKRAFRVQFTATDRAYTDNLFKCFFRDQNANIKIIFDYFFDDVKPLLLSDRFQGLPWSLRQTIMYTPKSLLLPLTMTWLNFKGADAVTTMLYRNLRCCSTII